MSLSKWAFVGLAGMRWSSAQVQGQGLLTPVAYIMGGDPVKKDEFPFYAEVHSHAPGSGTKNFCGGSVISKQAVVTAGHCVQDVKDAKNYLIKLRNGWELKGVAIKTPFHEKPTKDDFRNDIAIITLDREVPDDLIAKVDLEYDFLKINQKVYLAGKGQTEYGKKSSVLLKTEVKLMAPEKCNYSNFDSRLMICADGTRGNSSAKGDSGGPMVTEKNFLVGVTSFGGSQPGNSPIVYTKLSAFRALLVPILGGTKSEGDGGEAPSEKGKKELAKEEVANGPNSKDDEISKTSWDKKPLASAQMVSAAQDTDSTRKATEANISDSTKEDRQALAEFSQKLQIKPYDLVKKIKSVMELLEKIAA
jgi:hypothetical protein